MQMHSQRETWKGASQGPGRARGREREDGRERERESQSAWAGISLTSAKHRLPSHLRGPMAFWEEHPLLPPHCSLPENWAGGGLRRLGQGCGSALAVPEVSEGPFEPRSRELGSGSPEVTRSPVVPTVSSERARVCVPPGSVVCRAQSLPEALLGNPGAPSNTV